MPFVFGAQIDMSSSIPQGETAIVKTIGSFIDPVTKDNINFYRGHTQTSFDYDVGRIGDIYYIYFQTQGKPLNNYSINITGVRHYNGSQISNEPVSGLFTITSGLVDFYVGRGFIITDGNFSLSVQNLNSVPLSIQVQDSFLDDSVSFFFRDNEFNSGESFTLSAVEAENIDVSIQNLVETTIGEITLSTSNTDYTIPVYLILSSPGTIPVENDTDNNNETPAVENKTESGGKSFWDIFKKENKTEVKNLTNNSQGEITENNTSLKTCAQLNGTVCGSNQICQDGESVYAKDSTCCISSCVEKETKNIKKIIGWSLVAILVLFLLWFRIKYSRTRRRKFTFPTSSGKRF
jgi:hypothetical protein